MNTQGHDILNHGGHLRMCALVDEGRRMRDPVVRTALKVIDQAEIEMRGGHFTLEEAEGYVIRVMQPPFDGSLETLIGMLHRRAAYLVARVLTERKKGDIDEEVDYSVDNFEGIPIVRLAETTWTYQTGGVI